MVGIFQENWQLLVNTPHHADFTQPFYYLQSEKVDGEPIWHLVPMPGCQINAHIRSVFTLNQVVSHGAFATALFDRLNRSEQRAYLRTQLLNTYFPDTDNTYCQAKQHGAGYFHDLQAWVLNDPTRKVIRVQTEEEIFIRGGLFKRLVPQIYQQTCCISGMRLNSTFGHHYIDACHIVPFSVSHDDR